MAQINLLTFSDDLRSLYERTKTYYAIAKAQSGDYSIIEQISKEVLDHESEWNRIAKQIVQISRVNGEMLEKYAKTIQEMKITTRYDGQKAAFYLAPELNSVFDIAKYYYCLNKA